jgi:hypothetical protein
MNKISFDLGNSLLVNDTFPKETNAVGGLVSSLASSAIVIAGIISIILMVGGGIGYIASAGESNPQNLAKSKSAITAGIAGFVLVFCAYWIVQAIEILTGVNIF